MSRRGPCRSYTRSRIHSTGSRTVILLRSPSTPAETGKVLAVPKSAVVREQGETFVFVFDGGETFERRQVALGAEGADFYEIVSGLKEGERVVIEGVYQLRTTQAGE